MKNKWELYGYCEFGYRLWIDSNGSKVVRMPIPYVTG